jgi:hypothetical protein
MAFTSISGDCEMQAIYLQQPRRNVDHVRVILDSVSRERFLGRSELTSWLNHWIVFP